MRSPSGPCSRRLRQASACSSPTIRCPSGLALEVRDLVGLAVGLLLRPRELVLGLALALLLAALLPQRGVVGEAAGGLLHTAGDLVGDAHCLGLPVGVRGRSTRRCASESASSAAVTSPGAISSRPGSGAAACGSPRRPAHSARCHGRSGGGPHSSGGVGPKSTTEGVRRAVARWATPVSPQTRR